MSKTAILLTIVSLVVCTTGAFAQDPNEPDTVAMVVAVQPDADQGILELQLDLYVYNDNGVVGASVGFTWDNPNLSMDSAVASPLTENGFGIGPFFYEDNELAVTNTNQRFLFGGSVLLGSGIAADPSGPRLWASYYFTLSSWSSSDQIVIDTLTYSGGSVLSFIATGQITYKPIWGGQLIITDPNAPPPNEPPVLAGIGPQEGTEGQPLTINVSASDATTPGLDAQPLPSGATFTDNLDGTGSFAWTPGFFDAGVYNVTFYAIDSVEPGLVDSEAVVITVVDSNRVPVIAVPPGQNQSLDEGDTLEFLVTAEDPDSTIPSIVASLDGEDTLGTNMVLVDSGNGTGVLVFVPDFTQGNDDPTMYSLVFEAIDADDAGLIDQSEPVVFEVFDVNQPPVIFEFDDFLVCAGDSIEAVLSAFDADGDSLSLWVEPLAANMDFVDQGDGTGIFSFYPSLAQVGLFPLVLHASDGMATDMSEFVASVIDCGSLDSARVEIDPDFMFYFYQDAIDTMRATVYVGDFKGGHVAGDIVAASLLVNGTIPAIETALLPSYGDFTGEVLAAVIPIPEFLQGYGAFVDTTYEKFVVEGKFTGGSDFGGVGDITLRGHASGDINLDGETNIADVTYLVGFLYMGTEPPSIMQLADTDGSCEVNIADITYLVQHLYAGGPRPLAGCAP